MESILLIKRRESIILATIDAISECGVQAISTKDIAKKQGVSERVIFKHFPTKSKQMNPIEDIIFFLISIIHIMEINPL